MNPHGDVRSGFVFLEPRVFLCVVDIVLFVKYVMFIYILWLSLLKRAFCCACNILLLNILLISVI